MNELTINKDKLAEVYQNASAETKEALKALFGHESNFISKPKPTLDDYTTIRSYEDACEALGVEAIFNEPNPTMNLYGVEYEVPPHIIALMKLETISRALWEKIGCRSRMPMVQSGSIIHYLHYIHKKRLKIWMKMNVRACCLLVWVLVRLRASVVWTRVVVPRMHMRPVGFVCFKKRAKRLSISASSSWSCWRNT